MCKRVISAPCRWGVAVIFTAALVVCPLVSRSAEGIPTQTAAGPTNAPASTNNLGLVNTNSAGLAKTNSAETAKTNSFDLKVIPERTPIIGEIVRGLLVTGTNQITFVFPGGFRSQQQSAARKIVMTTPNSRCQISLHVTDARPALGNELKHEHFRGEVLARYAGAQIIDEYGCFISGMGGPAFELRRTASMSHLKIRIAFIALPDAILEVELTNSDPQTADYDLMLNELLLSLRITPVGQKPEWQKFSDKL